MATSGWIDWRKSKAREIIIDDLETGLLPVDAGELSAREAWEICYVHKAEFVDVAFSQFEKRLKDHRDQVGGHEDYGDAVHGSQGEALPHG